MAGKLNITSTGLKSEFTIPKIRLAIIRTVKLSAPMPFKKVEASKRPKKLASQVNKNLLTTNNIIALLQIYE
jgi:hypothetical protein